MDLYSLPDASVHSYQASVHQIPASSHIVGSEKMEQNKLLLKKKFQYPRVDLEESKFVDERSDHEKMASILRISSQILSKDKLTVWNQLAERYLENSTRYESGIPKIRADMLEEIKTYRISENKRKYWKTIITVTHRSFYNTVSISIKRARNQILRTTSGAVERIQVTGEKFDARSSRRRISSFPKY